MSNDKDPNKDDESAEPAEMPAEQDVAPEGVLRLTAAALVRDSGEPDVVASWAQQRPVPTLPEETLIFLLGSRYCETDLLSEIAWKLFAHAPLGWARVQAVCDFVHRH